jgi:GTPase SAR1 family protein
MKDTIEVQMKSIDILVIGPPRSGKTTMCRTFDLLYKLPNEDQTYYQNKFKKQQRNPQKFGQETVARVSKKKRSPPIEIADLGARCFKFDMKLGAGSTADLVKVTLWDPCTTEAAHEGDVGINNQLR